MPSSQSRSQAIRETLGLRIDPSPYTDDKVVITPHTPHSSSLASASQPDNSRSSTPGSDIFLFSVLCMYDFYSDDQTHLSFSKNEILEILQCTESGWWAAMRLGGQIVGWIPKGYVVPLSKSMAKRLRGVREELRIYEFEVEELNGFSPVARSLSAREAPSTIKPGDSSHKQGGKLIPSHNSPSSFRQVNEVSLRRRNTNPHLNSSYSPQPRPTPHPPPSASSPIPPLPTSVTTPSSKHWHPRRVDQDDSSRMRTGSFTSNKSLLRRAAPTEDSSALTLLTNVIGTKSPREASKVTTDSRTSDANTRRAEGPSRKESHGDSQIRTIITSRSPDDYPWYLRPQYADQLDVDPKGNIRSGSLLALVEKLTTEPPNSDVTVVAERKTFTHVFLMSFRTFMTPNRLFEMLVDRYYLKPPKKLTETEKKDWKAIIRNPTQGRVLDVFSLWLEDNRLLEQEPHIAQRLQEFLLGIVSAPLNSRAAAILQTLESSTFKPPKSVPATPKKPRKSKAHKNDLLKVDPVDIAEQLSLLEYGLYARITPQECLAYANTQEGPTVANLVEFCKTHDRLNGWVKASILNNLVLSKRADTIDYWIKVAEKCRVLNNFSSMSAIIIALSSTAIERLQLTWQHVGRTTQLETLLRHNEPMGGFAGYRNLMRDAEGAVVPFITMFLTDIAHIGEQFNQEDGRIAFYQRVRWCEVIKQMLRFQGRPYNFAVSESTMNFVDNHLREGGARDPSWFWSRSQEVQNSEMVHADIRKGLEAAGF